ncbi:MAG: hypothetical protein ABGY96_24895 [bacterium]|nr:hypothetical protein [Gammaproteobacteria bacterium]HIL94611.1 hypothetical protein [Pseudomonadales bacterium]
MKLTILPLLTLILMLHGLTAIAEQDKPEVKHCEEPRPQFCTMIYAPVCGTDDQGDRKTYPSGCSACSDTRVVEFEQGECQQVATGTNDD